MPSQRNESGCVSGNTPLPMIVVVTGMCVASANFSNSALAFAGDDAAAAIKHRALGLFDQAR